jgi:hypothetical protein
VALLCSKPGCIYPSFCPTSPLYRVETTLPRKIYTKAIDRKPLPPLAGDVQSRDKYRKDKGLEIAPGIGSGLARPLL